jgi:ABC-type protease/lipase transport system fused ATPase/permease subunit
VGIISLAVLAVVIFSRRSRNLAGAWRKTYVIGSVFTLYLNVLVLIAQIFQKVPGLKAIAPTQSEPPFVVAQLFVLVLFIAIGVFATIRVRDGLIRPAQIL